jgi:hypothetical protein
MPKKMLPLNSIAFCELSQPHSSGHQVVSRVEATPVVGGVISRMNSSELCLNWRLRG